MKANRKVAAVGVDVHYKFSSVTMRGPDGKVVRRERLEHGDRVALRRRLRQWPRGVPVVLEASFGWGWLSEEMEAAGLEVHLWNCRKVEQMRQARGWAKTNKKDSDLLSLLPMELQRWWEVWRPPADVRNDREWMRYRGDLVGMQTQTKNRIHAVFHRHGVFHDFSDLFGSKGRAFLAALCRDGRHQGERLPEGALAALRGQVRLLMQIRTQLAEVAWKLRGWLKYDKRTRRFGKIPGFGLILSHVMKAEIGRIERFGGDHRRLASYSLLGPGAMDTGEQDPGRPPLGRHLGHRGNRTLKWAFIEAAHGAVRKPGRFRRLFDRATAGGREDRNRGYVRVARELVKIVTAMWKNGTDYQEVPPSRSGSRKRRKRSGKARSEPGRLPPGEQGQPSAREQMEQFMGCSPGRTRSGTGQLSCPMVLAEKA